MMRSQCITILAVVIVGFMSFSTHVFAINGDMGMETEPLTDGTAEYPYLIEDYPDFQEFSNMSNSLKYWLSGVHVRLECDLDLDPANPALTDRVIYTTAVIAPDLDIADDFQGLNYLGLFDGNHHIISNLTIDTGGERCDYLGLFGCISGAGSEVKNLGIVDCNITTGNDSDYVGVLCGDNQGGGISNCYTTGKILGGTFVYNIGGLIGQNWHGIISNCYSSTEIRVGRNSGSIGGLFGFGYFSNNQTCYFTGKIICGNDSRDVGGVCGKSYEGSFLKCHSTGTILCGDKAGCVGGACGWNKECTFRECYSTGDIVCGDNSSEIGGLFGFQSYYGGIFKSCYSTGAVTTGVHSTSIGGLCGHIWGGSIINCYATGLLTYGEGYLRVGGISGYNIYGTISNSFWDIETSGIEISDGGIGKTTAEMKTVSTFLDAGWDFTSIWHIEVQHTYPLLRDNLEVDETPSCEHTCGDINGTGVIVNMEDFGLFASCWGKNPEIDINCICANLVEFDDHTIDMLDLYVLAELFLSSSEFYAPSCSTSITDPYAPTPNPMLFSSPPITTRDNSIVMTALEATDSSGVQYYFTCIAGGGEDSGWQDSRTYEFTNISPWTEYIYTVTARDKSGNQNITEASAPASTTQQPYNGTAFVVPGDRIEAEEFDLNGEGGAYHDNVAWNMGNAFRTEEDVDIKATSDVGGGYNVGWMENGEWLKYTIDIAPGIYDIQVRVSSERATPGDIKFSLNGIELGTVTVPNTGGWQNWQTITLSNVTITGGTDNILCLDVVSDITGYRYDLNWIEFNKLE